MTDNITPSFNQLKKTFLDSGFEIRFFPRRELESMALDAPAEVKRHLNSDILGLIMPDLDTIGIAKELTTQEKVSTLLHELVHLFNPNIDEEEVEALTSEIEETMTDSQYGFMEFLVA